MKTFYLTRDIRDPHNGRIHKSGGSIQTADPDMIKYLEDQLNAPLKPIPIVKPNRPVAPDEEELT